MLIYRLVYDIRDVHNSGRYAVSREQLIIVALGALLLITLVLLIAFAFRRKPGRGDRPEMLELLGRRLEQLEGISKDVANLSKVFLIPHARGGVGETLLNELLKNWLPRKAYEIQYSFRNGARVDAVIRLGEFMVPVDAKFPLESVRRSIEEGGEAISGEARRVFLRHIEAIRSKYIHPEEGTLQFALMYIPSERIYYHAFVEADSGLLEEAIRMGVVPVSPGGLFLYLQTVAYGLKGFVFSKKQRELIQITLSLRREIDSLKRLLETGGTHLRNLVKNRDEADKKIDEVESVLVRMDSAMDRAD